MFMITIPNHQTSHNRAIRDGWVPVSADGSEVVWRGPKKNGMIRQFLGDVRWGELDYLIIDTPPGTSDEHLSLMEHLAPAHSKLSAVVVTTPQAVALNDAMKCISFARTVNLPIVGLIENMSGYVCPCCGEVSNVFSTGGGEAMAHREGLTFLGSLPVDTELVTLLDASPPNGDAASQADLGNTTSFPLMLRYKSTSSSKLFEAILERVLNSPQNDQTTG
ncbi:P-loop containing nucleoside triphosphate hydrolase protein [Lentinula edodes]|uniref:p-loop containing nucleoside triphosphate hydrolase protein n=1 Tax=Lentinula edodes TaxID=5353 RepID=A0A1Q3DXH4_LENED|nr:P-loop containing nucleoside triphosphate hydrolase protein [Lentinula edodes]